MRKLKTHIPPFSECSKHFYRFTTFCFLSYFADFIFLWSLPQRSICSPAETGSLSGASAIGFPLQLVGSQRVREKQIWLKWISRFSSASASWSSSIIRAFLFRGGGCFRHQKLCLCSVLCRVERNESWPMGSWSFKQPSTPVVELLALLFIPHLSLPGRSVAPTPRLLRSALSNTPTEPGVQRVWSSGRPKKIFPACMSHFPFPQRRQLVASAPSAGCFSLTFSEGSYFACFFLLIICPYWQWHQPVV